MPLLILLLCLISLRCDVVAQRSIRLRCDQGLIHRHRVIIQIYIVTLDFCSTVTLRREPVRCDRSLRRLYAVPLRVPRHGLRRHHRRHHTHTFPDRVHCLDVIRMARSRLQACHRCLTVRMVDCDRSVSAHDIAADQQPTRVHRLRPAQLHLCIRYRPRLHIPYLARRRSRNRALSVRFRTLSDLVLRHHVEPILHSVLQIRDHCRHRVA